MRVCCILLITVVLLTGCSELEWMFNESPLEPTMATVSGDPVRGETLFKVGVEDAPPCSTCHQVGVGGNGFSLAPNLADVASRAANHNATPEQYIRESILDPEKIKIEGFRVSMYPDYAEHLSQQDINDIIAYLMLH